MGELTAWKASRRWAAETAMTPLASADLEASDSMDDGTWQTRGEAAVGGLTDLLSLGLRHGDVGFILEGDNASPPLLSPTTPRNTATRRLDGHQVDRGRRADRVAVVPGRGADKHRGRRVVALEYEAHGPHGGGPSSRRSVRRLPAAFTASARWPSSIESDASRSASQRGHRRLRGPPPRGLQACQFAIDT